MLPVRAGARRAASDLERHCIVSDAKEYWFKGHGERLPVFEEILTAVQRHHGPGRILDVGCGTGGLLLAARARGFSPLGVELSHAAREHARCKSGLDVRLGTVTEQHFDDHSFDVITALEVIDYPRNPIDELREYRRILAQDGVLVVECRCNRWSWLFSCSDAAHRLLRGKPMRVSESIVSRFLSAWGTFTANYMLTTRTLEAFLRKAGWEIRECRNLRTIESARRLSRIRPGGIYRGACNALERATWRHCAIGPKIVVVASPRTTPDLDSVRANAAHSTSGKDRGVAYV